MTMISTGALAQIGPGQAGQEVLATFDFEPLAEA
jgi:hypothetical protein